MRVLPPVFCGLTTIFKSSTALLHLHALALLVLGSAQQVHANSYAEFPADGALLGTAVAHCCSLSTEAEAQSDCTFSDPSGNYGPMKSWRTGLVTTMEGLFYEKQACNPDISGWDTSSVTIMAHMFRDSGFNRDISNWNIAKVTNMDSMFNGASSFKQNLCSWNSNFPYGSLYVFHGSGCTFTGDPVEANKGPFCTSVSCLNFPADGVLLGTAVAQYCELPPEEQSTFTFSHWGEDYGRIEDWKTGLVTNMESLFYDKSSCNPDISGWDTSSVTIMAHMFRDSGFNRDISKWNIAKVTNMDSMFNGASSFNQDLCPWKSDFPYGSLWVFAGSGCTFTGDPVQADLGPFCVSLSCKDFPADGALLKSAVDTYCALSPDDQSTFDFVDGTDNYGRIENWGTGLVTNMEGLFAYKSSCNPDIRRWDTSSVTIMAWMFGNSGFNRDVSSWNIAKVTNMDSMFNGASSFNQNLCSWSSDFPYGRSTSVFLYSGCTYPSRPVEANKGPFCGDSCYAEFPADGDLLKTAVAHCCALSPEDEEAQSNCNFSDGTSYYGPMKSWRTGLVTSMFQLFVNQDKCNPDISGWDVSAVTEMHVMFYGATLFNRDLSNWDVSSATNMAHMFNGASSFDSDLSQWDVSSVWNMGEMFEGAEAFNSDISSWNIAKVTIMGNMFNGASSFNQNLCLWSSDFPYGSASGIFTNSGCTFTSDPVEANKGPFCTSVSCKPSLAPSSQPSLTPSKSVVPSSQPSINPSYPTIPTSQPSLLPSKSSHPSLQPSLVPSMRPSDIPSMRPSDIPSRSPSDIPSKSPSDEPSSEPSSTPSVSPQQSSFYAEFPADGALLKTAVDQYCLSSDQSTFEFGSGTDNYGRIEEWRTGLVTDMKELFRDKSSCNPNISGWDTSSVTTMAHMFRDSGFNRDISSWNIAKVTNMDSMFNGASSFNQNLCSWSSDLPYGSASVFLASGCTFQDNPVQTNLGPFCGDSCYAEFPADNAWPSGLLRKAVNQYCDPSTDQSNFRFIDENGNDYGPIEGWKTGRVTNMYALFYYNECNPDISGWDTSSVTNMQSMFHGAYRFNRDLSSWNTTAVTTMAYMFYDAANFNGDVSTWNIVNVANMDRMFSMATSFNQNLCSWNSNFPYGSLYVFLASACPYTSDPVQANKGPFCGNSCYAEFPADGALLKTAVDQYCLSSDQSTFEFVDGTDNYGRIEEWKTGRVTTMESLFYGKSSCNPNISGWDTSSVTTMAYMFRDSGFNRDISSWNIAKVTNMAWMFNGASSFEQDLTSWDISSVTNMDSMFYGASSFNQNLCSWKSDFPYGSASVFLASGCTFTSDPVQANLGPFCGHECKYAEFPADNPWPSGLLRKAVNQYCDPFTDQSNFRFIDENGNDYGPIEDWKTGRVTNMYALFYFEDSCNPDISGWDTSSVTNMQSMFHGAYRFNRDLSSWNTTAVTTMAYMFYDAANFNGDVSTWDTGAVTDMGAMFYGANSFNGIVSSWNTAAVTSMQSMFQGAISFNGDVSTWNTARVTSMSYMFHHASAFNQNLCSWSSDFPYGNSNDIFTGTACTFTSNPLQANEGPFCGYTCKLFPADGALLKTAVDEYCALTSEEAKSTFEFIDGTNNYGRIEDWKTGLVTTMYALFYYKDECNPDISRWDTSLVTNMHSMFHGASSFDGDVSNWNTGAVTDMGALFYEATSFSRDLSKWEVSSAAYMAHMFYGATSFDSDLSKWEVSSATNMAHMFEGATSFNRDISSWNIAKVTNMDSMFNGASSFNQNLCSWSSDFPYGNSNDIFLYSDCTYPSNPVEANKGPFCGNDCAPSSHPSSSSVPSSSLEPSISPTAELGGKVVATFEATIGFTGVDISSLSDSSLRSFSALLEDEIGRVVPVPAGSGSSSEVTVRSIDDDGNSDFSVIFDISMTQLCEPEAACPVVQTELLALADTAKLDILELESNGSLTHDVQSSLVTNPIVGINGNTRERRLPQSRKLNGITTTGATASAPQAIVTLRSDEPSSQPSSQPSDVPSLSLQPSDGPSLEPTPLPSTNPTSMPSDMPSFEPSSQPSSMPSDGPSSEPSSQPSGVPSSEPSSTPSCSPSSAPTESPSTASGVNLFYPEWVSGREGCRNDGNEPDYMAMNPTDWLSSTMETCCKKFFGGYLYDDCIGKHSQGHDDCNVKLYYPDWNGANDGCTDDGQEPYYMLSNAQYFLSNTREECCEKFYGWNYFECAGTKPQSSGGYYPDWTGASSSPNTCLNDGKEPLYMLNSPMWYLSPTLEECCDRHFHWALNDCTGTQDVGSGKWYVKYDAETCVQDCTGASNSNCGGIAKSWDELFGSKKACCDEKLWYVDNCISN